MTHKLVYFACPRWREDGEYWIFPADVDHTRADMNADSSHVSTVRAAHVGGRCWAHGWTGQVQENRPEETISKPHRKETT